MAEWPLRGRDSELAHVAELLGDPQAYGVVLAGPQGVGKTRLGMECLKIAADMGFAVDRILATHATSTLPLGAVILSRPPQDARATPPAEQSEILHRVAADLVRRGGGRRLVLLVDDVHWLDSLSAMLVHQLVLSKAAFVILTSRTGASAPEPIASLWKENRLERMTVNALRDDAIEELLTHALGAPIARATVADLVDSCEGNILFLREQVLAAEDEGVLRMESGVWRLDRTSTPPTRLVELIEHRLAGLESRERTALEVIAFGEPLDLADLAPVADVALVEQLEKQGLISVRPDDWGSARVLLAYPLLGEVLRAATSVLRARQITQTLALAAEARSPLQLDELMRVASWRLICGGATADLMLGAARTAHARRDYRMATRFAQAAVAAGAGCPAEIVLADAIGHTGRREEAEAALAELAEKASDPTELSAIAQARLLHAHLNGDIALGHRVYRESLRCIEEPRLRAELAARRSWVVMMQEGPRGGMRAVEEAAVEQLDDWAVATTSIVRTAARARAGRVTEALESARVGLAAQLRLTQPFDVHPFAHDFYVCEALAFAGRVDEWADLAEARYAAAVAERTATMQACFAYQCGKAALARGRVRTAARLAGEAVGISRQLHDPNFEVAALTTLAEALALSADLEGAAHALSVLDSVRHPPYLFAEPANARAWVAIARGDMVSARRTLESEFERAIACDDLFAAAQALHSLVRMGDAKLASNRLTAISERVEGELVPTQALHASAIASRDFAALVAVADTFERLGRPLLAAEAYCDAATVVRHAGDPKRAATFAQTAEALLDRCEGAVTPATQPLQIRTELTQAERRTAMLAAQGRSNRDIAEVERVSVRTVESRLQCVYFKLGISSRKDLAGALAGEL